MILSATGIVTAHNGDLLLIQRNDTRTFAAPGGGAEPGELPAQTAVREVREETGLIVQAVRLVGVYHLPTRPVDYLTLCFRCITRGGEISPSSESVRVGFFRSNPLPRLMLFVHRQRLQDSLSHRGGPPIWRQQDVQGPLMVGAQFLQRVVYPWFNLRRKLSNAGPFEPPSHWQIMAAAIIRDVRDRVLWLRASDNNQWVLPGSLTAPYEAPWDAAVRAAKARPGLSIELGALSGVYPAPDTPAATFTFTARVTGPGAPSLAPRAAFFAPGQEPDGALSEHITQVEEAAANSTAPHFRFLGAPAVAPGVHPTLL